MRLVKCVLNDYLLEKDGAIKKTIDDMDTASLEEVVLVLRKLYAEVKKKPIGLFMQRNQQNALDKNNS